MKNTILATCTCIAVAFAAFSAFHCFSEDRKKQIIFAQKTDKGRFTKIYELGYWTVNYNGITSGPSGAGAIRDGAVSFLEFLQNFVDSMNIKTIVDMGCGDFQLLKHLILPDHIRYLGLDIVDDIILHNTEKYAKANMKFEIINEFEELEKYSGDLLIIKDVLQIWNVEQIQYFIKKILPKYKYAIIVNNSLPLAGQKEQNADIVSGDSRPVNLGAPPFNVKLEVIKEYSGYGRRKRICLYTNPKLADGTHFYSDAQ
jgi:hypothetical protein